MLPAIGELADSLIDLSPEFLKNPYACYDQLRKEEPVLWSDKGKSWFITRYDDNNKVIRDIKFSKRIEAGAMQFLTQFVKTDMAPLLAARNHWILNQDPPDHTRLRGLMNKAFIPTMINELHSRIEAIANELIDKVMPLGEMDLIAEFAFPLPITVISEMLGVPPADRDTIKIWSTAITNAFDLSGKTDGLKGANKAAGEFINYLRPIVASRRKNPQSDLISVLVQAEEEGSKLSEEELFANCVLLLLAGHETTVNLIGNGSYALLTHPQQLTLLKEKPELMPQAVDEVLRYNSPVQLVRRRATEDFELHGKTIKKNDVIACLLGAANHDPEVFADPDRFDITRKDNKYLSFGAGIHHCIGSTLAKAEGEIAFTTLFKRLPNLKLRTENIQYKRHPSLRGLTQLPVSF